MTASTTSAAGASRAFWALRVLETGFLLSALVGLVLFAVSIVDIVRIETAPARQAASPAAQGSTEPTSGAVAEAVKELPAGAWPGIFLFFGSLVALQPVRAILIRYRRDDGSQRGAGTRDAVAATAAALAAPSDEPGPADEAALEQREG